MPDISAIAGFATSVRAAVEITKAMKDIHDSNILQTKTFELTREIMAAQSYAMEAAAAQSELLGRVRQLEEEKAKLEAWNTEKERYELKELKPGVLIYSIKDSMRGAEPEHYLCPTCYNRGKKSILQKEMRDVGRAVLLVCHECGTELYEHGMRLESSAGRGGRR